MNIVRSLPGTYSNDFEATSLFITGAITTNRELQYRPHKSNISQVKTNGGRCGGGGRGGGAKDYTNGQLAAAVIEIRRQWFAGNTKGYVPKADYDQMSAAQKAAVYQLREEYNNKNEPLVGDKRKIAALKAQVKNLKAAAAASTDAATENQEDDDDIPDDAKSNAGHPGLGRQPGNPRGGDRKNV